MGEGFDHLRCPMCGGELIYSEGTHDLCCARNPYESMSGRNGRQTQRSTRDARNTGRAPGRGMPGGSIYIRYGMRGRKTGD